MTDAPKAPELKNLRDEFAMAALTAMTNWISPHTDCGHAAAAEAAYRYANAMMEARRK